VRRFQPFVTSLGWHGTMGRGRRSILGARYDFLHFVAGVVIVADHRQRLAETRPTVRAYLKSARPRLSAMSSPVSQPLDPDIPASFQENFR
jgi:hypothetical protein